MTTSASRPRPIASGVTDSSRFRKSAQRTRARARASGRADSVIGSGAVAATGRPAHRHGNLPGRSPAQLKRRDPSPEYRRGHGRASSARVREALRRRHGPGGGAARLWRRAGGPCYHPPPAADPWCSGPTCQPVTLEIAGSNPVGSAIHLASSRAPSARPDGAPLFPTCPPDAGARPVWYAAAVSVRDPGFDPRRRNRPRFGAHPMQPERRRPAWLIPVALVGAIAAVVAGDRRRGVRARLGRHAVGRAERRRGWCPRRPPARRRRPTRHPRRRPIRPRARPRRRPTPRPRRRPSPRSSTATSRSSPSSTSVRRPSAVSGRDVRDLADGGEAFANVVLVEADADAILAALRLDRGGLGDRLKTVPSRDALAARLSRQKDDLGFLRADEVGPDVRAIGWGSDTLFGVDRVKSLDAGRSTRRSRSRRASRRPTTRSRHGRWSRAATSCSIAA